MIVGAERLWRFACNRWNTSSLVRWSLPARIMCTGQAMALAERDDILVLPGQGRRLDGRIIGQAGGDTPLARGEEEP